MSEINNETIAPINYLKIFFRRKELLFIPVFIGLVIGICAGFLIPKQYMSSSVILVQEGKSDNPLFTKLAVSTTVRQRMVGIKESILGWHSLTELVKRLDLAKDVDTKIEYEELIEKLKKNIVIQLRGHNILHLGYVSTNPEMTQKIVQNITDIFIERNVHMQDTETSDAIAFIEEQLEVYKGKIKSAEIAKLQDELDDYLIDSTNKHPQVRKYKELIEARKKELKELDLAYVESDDFGSDSTNPIINEIKRTLDTIESSETPLGESRQRNDKYNVTLNVDLEKVMARDASVNESIYGMLLERLETAKITQRLQSSKEGTRYTIVDPPRVPLEHIKPNKFIVAVVGIFLGALAGIGLVGGAEFLDKSFIDVEDAKNFLGKPLLGAISKINTIESIRRAKERKRWLYGMTFAIGIIAIIVTVSVSHFMGI